MRTKYLTHNLALSYGTGQRIYTCFLLFVLLSGGLSAQQEDPKRRFSFAQTYVGLQADWLHGSSSVNSGLASPDFGVGRMIIGGRHFWGKADFYISFPLYGRPLSGPSDWQYSEGVITGARYMPIRLGKTFQPYIGVQWLNPSFVFKEGPLKSRSAVGLEAGLLKIFARSWSVGASAHFIPKQHYNYYLTRTSTTKAQVPDWGFSLCVKKYFDFTSGLASSGAQKRVQQDREVMKKQGGLSTFSVALGFSASFGLSPVPYAEQFPWVNQKVQPALYPDIGLGYYFHRPDLSVSLSYRPINLNQGAYGLNLYNRQRHVTLEAFKFLFDYHGFVPFIGLGFGTTYYHFKAKDDQNIIADQKGWTPNAALVFGWDIRPTNTDWLILRTNLRYLPPLSYSGQGKRLTSSQLEVNFIQAIFYPERFILHRQTR